MAPNIGLSPSNVVNVTSVLAPIPAGYRNFGASMVVGPTNTIDVSERRREYSDIDGVAEDFPNTSPEFLWAQTFFAQEPKPDLLYIGRWAQSATAGVLHGAILTPAQQLMSVFQGITSGSFYVEVDGVAYSVTGLNFSGAVNLNGVASIIQAALTTLGSTARVIWGAVNQRFDVISGTTGATSTVSYGLSPTASGAFTFSAQPLANSSIVLNGTTVTFVTGTPTGPQVQIGAALANTLASLLLFLRSSSDTQLVKMAYTVTGSKLYVRAVAPGTAGNAFTLAVSSSPSPNATVSGATLSGGSGTDVSVTLGLSQTPNATGANASVPVAGVAPESLLTAINYFSDYYPDWYFLSAVGAIGSPISDSDHLSIAAFIEAASPSREYFLTVQNTAAMDSTRTDDLGSILKSLNYERTGYQYSTSNAYAVASLVGRCATINFLGSNTTITLKFKQEPGVVAEYLSQNQWATLKAKNYNVMAAYKNGTAILQNGVMANGYFIDEVQGSDWLADFLQTNCYDLLLEAPKVPQTDSGVHLLVLNMTASCSQAVVNGLLAPGIWNAAGFGTLNESDNLPLGFYIYAPLVASQPEVDRAGRHAPPIQIAAKFAGAIHDVDVTITYNR